MKSNLSCPVCGSDLIYETTDDGITKLCIKKDKKGEIQYESLHCSNDGSISVYCRKNMKHKIPNKLEGKIISLAESLGF